MTGPPDRLLRRLEWTVVRRLDGRLQGQYRTVFRGTGTEFTGLREYTLEDDVRHIDWNVTARLSEPYVRQYTEDRDLTAWLVLDQSASMRFGTGGDASSDAGAGREQGQGKDGVLTELAGCLARVFARTGNKVGAILYDNQRHRIIPPRTGRDHVLYVIHELTRAPATAPDGRTTDLAAMLHLAAATARRRSLVFVISDFIADADWAPALTRLSHRHEVVTIRIVDPIELDLPDLGLVVVEDAETGEQLVADTGDPLFRQRLRAQVDAREAAVTAGMRRAGVTAHRVGTGEDLAAALVDMFRQSRRRRVERGRPAHEAGSA